VVAIACALADAGWGQYLETTVPVGYSPAEVLWAGSLNKVYCANSQDATVTVIDGASNAVVATVPVGDYPDFLCWNPQQNKVYCTRGEGDVLVAIDALADTVLHSVRLSGYPATMAMNHAMNKLYVGCYDSNRIAVLDAGPDTVIRHIPARGVGALLWSPATNRVFFCGADTIKVIDCATDEIVARMQGGGTDWCYNSVDDLVYLTAGLAVYVLSPAGDSVVAVVPGYASAAAAAPFPNKVFVAGAGPGGAVIRVVDGSTHAVLDSLLVGGGWMSLVTDLAKGRVYCSNVNAHKVDIIDARSDTLIKTIALGRDPVRLCWNQTNSRVYTTDYMDNVVYVIRDTTTGVAEEAPRLAGPCWGRTVFAGTIAWPHMQPGALVDMSGRRVAVLRQGSNELSRLAPGVYVVVEAQGRPLGKVAIIR
jgi:YVTN family beta-propeller protein